MTSQERHEARYQRRRAARRARQEARCAALGSLGEVFSYHTMFKYGRKCCNGVRWKQSTQNFERHLFSNTAKQRRLILAKRWRPKKYVHFTVCERGICFPTQRSSGGLFWQKGGGLRNTFISRSANAARFVGLTLLILQTDKSTRSSARKCWSRFTTPA